MKLYRIQALLLKYWFISKNSVERLFDLLYWPLLGMIIFGFTALFVETNSNISNIAVYLIGGLLLLWIMLERVQNDINVYILEDFWSRNVANTFITPVKESEIFVSVALLGLFRSAISFVLMLVVAYGLYSFNLFFGGYAVFLFIIPLLLFGWALGLFITGLIFRYGTRIQIFAWSVTYLLQPIAAVYYPLATLPSFLQSIAHAFPLMYIFEGFRLSYQGTLSLWHLSWAIGLALIYLLGGYLFFRYSLKRAKKVGLLSNY